MARFVPNDTGDIVIEAERHIVNFVEHIRERLDCVYLIALGANEIQPRLIELGLVRWRGTAVLGRTICNLIFVRMFERPKPWIARGDERPLERRLAFRN